MERVRDPQKGDANQNESKPEHRKRLCASYAEAHTEAARYFAKRNSQLALLALVFSALIAVPAIGTAINNSVSVGASPVEGGTAQVVPLAAQWIIATLALLAAVANGAQQRFGNVDRATKHEEAARGYRGLWRDIDRGDMDLKTIDDQLDDIEKAAPRVPKKFQSKIREFA